MDLRIGASWRRLPLRRQVAVLAGGLVVAVVLLSLYVSVVLLQRNLETQYEQRALAIARSVAQDGRLAGWVVTSRPAPSGPVQATAEQVRRATGALYVVVTDREGTRFSHPSPGLVGGRVSTDPSAALAGREEVSVDTGTLGESARAKVPLRDEAGRVVGEVSVGMTMTQVRAASLQLTRSMALLALAAMALGVLGALAFGRHIRRTTLGLEPVEMADLLREHEAVLTGVRDGVVAVDERGRVTFVNEEARAALGVGDPVLGVPVDRSGLGRDVEALFAAPVPPAGELAVVRDRALLVTRLPVRRDGRSLGTVLVLRDRTDVEEIGRELQVTRALTDALRAQAHEYTNRLHALSGLLHLGHVEEAQDYLDDLRASTVGEALTDPYLAGLVAAKQAVASEAGVRLRTTEATWVEGRLLRPLDAVTVVGNLVDNAVRAARSGGSRPPWVELTLVSDDADLLVHVVDSGDGVPQELAEAIFRRGVSTRPDATGHGYGLALARSIARAAGGDVRLLPAGEPVRGAAFEARLPAILDTRSAGGG